MSPFLVLNGVTAAPHRTSLKGLFNKKQGICIMFHSRQKNAKETLGCAHLRCPRSHRHAHHEQANAVGAD